ncbi:DivIVA domain-containing protein [Actinoplanes solisilvae]|uniref:DivIVA domain-containing protein n=1 Tax=Actinoplanes solisilvae TaxID=2486853 RepID=UPI0013E3ED49|nr:DivIVA domain-containing protein [Actinoplanes solisilvae]
MPLTPADIQNAIFTKASIGKRGYDEEQVDSLLDEVTQEMIRLLEANEQLRQQAGQLRPEAAPAPRDRTGEELSAAGAELNRALRARDQAEQSARELRNRLDQARRAAAAAPPEPPVDNGPVMAMAQRTADDHMRDARRQSDSLISEAREKSAQVIDEARATADNLEITSRRRYEDSLDDLQAERTQVLRDIDGLTHMAEDYKAALHDHMIHQQQLLDGTVPA